MAGAMPHKTTIFLLLGMMGLPWQAGAREYGATVNESAWISYTSEGRCELLHPIPDYGEALFVRRGPDSLSFQVRHKRGPLQAKNAVLKAVPPSWRSDLTAHEIRKLKVGKGDTPFALMNDNAIDVMNELENGLFPTIVYQDRRQVTVAVSSVNFLPALEQFLGCDQTSVAQLEQVPVISALGPDGAQPADWGVINFRPDSAALSRQARHTLDALIGYQKANPDIKEFVVTGYTDTAGGSSHSIKLTLARSGKVREYFIAKGIPASKIKILYSGEYIPSNTKRPRKSKRNRQVSINLTR